MTERPPSLDMGQVNRRVGNISWEWDAMQVKETPGAFPAGFVMPSKEETEKAVARAEEKLRRRIERLRVTLPPWFDDRPFWEIDSRGEA